MFFEAASFSAFLATKLKIAPDIVTDFDFVWMLMKRSKLLSAETPRADDGRV